MTIEKLKKYRDICSEIKDIKSKLSGSYVGDTVQSGSKHPYSVHNVHIEGLVPSGNTVSLLARLSDLKKQKSEIEEYIENIDDYQTKKMFEMKFFEYKTYLQIAMTLSNGKMSESCVKKRIYRYVRHN